MKLNWLLFHLMNNETSCRDPCSKFNSVEKGTLPRSYERKLGKSHYSLFFFFQFLSTARLTPGQMVVTGMPFQIVWMVRKFKHRKIKDTQLQKKPILIIIIIKLLLFIKICAANQKAQKRSLHSCSKESESLLICPGECLGSQMFSA